MIEQEELQEYVSESEISDWEEQGKVLDLYVCSTCGYISNEIHDCKYIGSDNWMIKVKVIKSEEAKRE